MKEVLDALKGHRTSNIVSSTFIVQYLLIFYVIVFLYIEKPIIFLRLSFVVGTYLFGEWFYEKL